MRRFDPFLAGAGIGAIAAAIVAAGNVLAYAIAPLYGIALLVAFRKRPLPAFGRFAVFALGTAAWILFLYSSYVLGSIVGAYAYDHFARARSWAPEWSYFVALPLAIALWVGLHTIVMKVAIGQARRIGGFYTALLGFIALIALASFFLKSVQAPTRDWILLPFFFVGFWGISMAAVSEEVPDDAAA